MKVIELIEILRKENPNHIVVISIDPEGNRLRKITASEGDAMYMDYGSHIDYTELTPAMIEQGYTKEDMYQGNGGQACVVLWP